jgi:hypothetical protein
MTWGWIVRNGGAVGMQVHAVHWLGKIGERERERFMALKCSCITHGTTCAKQGCGFGHCSNDTL